MLGVTPRCVRPLHLAAFGALLELGVDPVLLSEVRANDMLLSDEL